MANQIQFEPWGVQNDILRDKHRIIGAFAGKRGGKTEVGAVKTGLLTELKPGHKPSPIDPFLTAIIAPTHDMLERLSWKKFYAYNKGFMPDGYNKKPTQGLWHDGSEVIGMSADNPTRIEGIKAKVIWLDEVFQMNEQTFLECRARIADTKGYLICTGSLGVQIINPKQHWAYKYFKQQPDKDTICYEWNTSDNPHFPQDELETLRNTLDPQTFRQMFEIDWDTIPKNAVYLDWTSSNELDHYTLKEECPIYVSIDWGYAHHMAVGFFQVDHQGNVVMFDEIVEQRLVLETLYEKLKTRMRLHGVTDWCCDIAGNQEREQTGKSNVKWFKDRGIHFNYRSSSILNGISLVRSFIKNTQGVRRFYITKNCKKSIDGIKQYRYPEKDGQIQNENPIKRDDDACFDGSTLIHCKRGSVKIKDITTDDYVLTRDGYKKVLGLYKIKDKETILYNVNGNLIRATPDHKFYTSNGFVSIECLTQSDTFNIVSAWQNLKQLFSTELNTTNTKTENIINVIFQTRKKVLDFCIEIFGNSIMAPLRKVSTFIIKMGIRSIMILRILNVLMPTIICLLIQKLNFYAQFVELKIKNILIKSEALLLNGIKAMRGLFGIELMLRKLGVREFQLNTGVSIACPIMNLSIEKDPIDFVQTNVNPPQEDQVELITSKLNVQFVKQNSQRTNIQTKVLARRNALAISDQSKVVDVYSLIIEDKPEFYANNILVSNCDMIRYFFINFMDDKKSQPKNTVSRLR